MAKESKPTNESDLLQGWPRSASLGGSLHLSANAGRCRARQALTKAGARKWRGVRSHRE
jgi:hypothetical protein